MSTVAVQFDTPMVALAASDEGPARLEGLAVPFGVPSGPSSDAKRYRFAGPPINELVGAVAVREHDDFTPIGKVFAAAVDSGGISVVIDLLDTNAGRDAHKEAAAGVRNGFSVRFTPTLCVVDDDGIHDVAEWELRHVGHVRRAAFADTHAAAASAAPDDHASERTPTMPEELQAEPTPEPTTGTLVAGPAAPRATTRPVSHVMELAARLQGARWDGGDGEVMRVINLALTDITPVGNGAGNDGAGLAVQAVGELIDGAYFMPQHDAMVTPRTLTGAKITGWFWSVRPSGGVYAGNKAEIPTNAATLDEVTKTPSRYAGGHDLDRIYIDLGSPEMIASYWRIMVEENLEYLDNAKLTAVETAAGTPGSATSVAGAITQGIIAVKNPSYAAVASDLWAAEMAKPADTLPAIFTGGNIFGDERPPLSIFPTDGLTGEVIVGSRTAVDFYTTSPPVKVEAVVVAKAGIDAALYSYYGDIVVNAARVKAYTVTPLPLAARTGRAKD